MEEPQPVVVITGASSGIGEAIATHFVRSGAHVLTASRSPAGVDGARWQATDVRVVDDVERLISIAVEELGRLDVVVNCAGVQVEQTVTESSDADYDLVMDVNVRGVFNMCRAGVAQMVRQQPRGGVIVNIGSTAATHSDHGMALYNASKAAVHALTRSVAVDHGAQGIRAVTIAPGWIATALADAAFDQADDPAAARAEAVDRHPIGRLGTPDDVAALAVWLASDQAGFASGSVFTLDGGLTSQSPIRP